MTGGDDFETELSRTLLQLRKAVVPTLNQMSVATHTGISQGRLSRIERGRALPTEDEVLALARLYGADDEQTAHLVQLAKDLRNSLRDDRLVVQRGSTLAHQLRVSGIEAETNVVRGYQPVAVFGVLQTAAYAAIATRQPLDSPAVRERQLRRARLLSGAKPRHLLIQTEGALRQTVGSAEVMAEQLDAIVHAAAQPNVELGVIPASKPLMLIPNGGGFHVYDQAAVALGFEGASLTLTKPDDVQTFLKLWDWLWMVALHGDEAINLVRAIRSGEHR
jgi:transcriptional regulator with XRE-family HTH domain